MALSEAQILNSLLCLGLPARTDIVFQYYGDGETLRQTEVARLALANLNAAQEAKVIEILAQYATVEYDTDDLKSEGLDSKPARLRALCRSKLANTICFCPPGGMGLTIQRG